MIKRAGVLATTTVNPYLEIVFCEIKESFKLADAQDFIGLNILASLSGMEADHTIYLIQVLLHLVLFHY